MQVIESDGIKVFLLPIAPEGNVPRRERERQAVAELVLEAFGPGAALGHDSHGAPFVTGSCVPEGTMISVSHSRSTAALAVANGTTVGVDIESWRPQLRSVAPRFLSPGELAVFTFDRALLSAWTSKEAVFKAAGEPELVISDVKLSPDLSSAAIPSDLTFRLIHHELSENLLVTIALPDA